MKQEKLELIIPKKSTGKRIDIALQELMSDYSRAKLQAWIKSGFILLDSKKISSKDIVFGGETVSIEVQQDEKILQFEAENIPLNIVYEDENLFVINKDQEYGSSPSSWKLEWHHIKCNLVSFS
jgi:23S rRNA pseudouridine1911/1915/1917 synthase